MSTAKDPSGRATFETKKSSRSMMVLFSPSGLMKESRLKPSAQGIERRKRIGALRLMALWRVHWRASIVMAMMFSKTAMTVVSAANANSTKKADPTQTPSPWGICAKTLGSVMKMRSGPWSGRTS